MTEIRIGLVNIMPDAALEATERQFRSILQAASDGNPVHLSRYTLPEIPRSKAGRVYLSAYLPVTDLGNASLDGLIVTGTESCAKTLADEPCWPTLRQLVEWAEDHTYSSLWSCLSAQAAVMQMDGIHRRRLSEKRFGIFDCSSKRDHPLTFGIPERIRIPHSRWNDIPAEALASHGYHILSMSERAGVDMFVKQRKSLFVCCQGHPEYETDTLLREYRRDIRRFLTGEMAHYPAIPEGYFNEEASRRLRAFKDSALHAAAEEFLTGFPTDIAPAIETSWRENAVQLYRNWLAYIREQKTHHSGTPESVNAFRPAGN